MNKELERARSKMRDLILTNCNVIGCANCSLTWDTDKNGNSCRSDELQNEEMALEEESINDCNR